MSYGYVGRQNPYDQRDNAPGGYGRQQQQPQQQYQQQQQQGGYSSGGGYGQENAYGGKDFNLTAVSVKTWPKRILTMTYWQPLL
ncbi:hypothetical protein E4U52_002935 [Claviceps spartinae]|nr:hypothetical protein E4U52_002935 [Claviceps spartinae]